METELLPLRGPANLTPALPPLPWRDPHSVPPEQLAAFIEKLDAACRSGPPSARLQTCLGIAHAMNLDVYKSMDAFEEALRTDSTNFLARAKLGELFLRLRVLGRAEEETRHALDCACNCWELTLARRQLQTIRDMKAQGMLRPELTKSLRLQGAAFAILGLVVSVAALWLR